MHTNEKRAVDCMFSKRFVFDDFVNVFDIDILGGKNWNAISKKTWKSKYEDFLYDSENCSSTPGLQFQQISLWLKHVLILSF